MKKKFFALFIMAIMLLSLASCANVSSYKYDDITSLFIRRELAEEDEVTSYAYSISVHPVTEGEFVLNALSFNLDGSITDLQNHPVDEATMNKTRDFCKEHKLIDYVENYNEEKENTPDAFEKVFYTITLQFKDGSEIYAEIQRDTDEITAIHDFMMEEINKALDSYK